MDAAVLSSNTFGPAEPCPSDRAWYRAHLALQGIARRRRGLDYEEGCWLLVASEQNIHRHFGYASFGEYVERVLGHGRHETAERLRVAKALEALPAMTNALKQGILPWSALRELTRVATPVTEAAWLEASSGQTVQHIQALVSGLSPGQLPGNDGDPDLCRHVLRLDVSGETLATFREAMAKVRRDAGGPLDEDAVLLEVARRVLGSSRREGEASYQISITMCPQCERAWQHSNGDLVEVAAGGIDMARCDGLDIGVVPGALSGLVATGAGGAGDRASHVGPPDDGKRADGSPSHDGSGAPDGGARGGAASHVGLDRSGSLRDEILGSRAHRAIARAAQTIPPAVRRFVVRRDGHRCAVPGCRSSIYVDVHHIQPRHEGGDHDVDNLIVLCGAHHRAVHEGALFVSGRYATGIEFRHADGTPYGGPVEPRVAHSRALVFGALRKLGFPDAQARAAVAALPLDGEQDTDALLRRALACGTPPRPS